MSLVHKWLRKYDAKKNHAQSLYKDFPLGLSYPVNKNFSPLLYPSQMAANVHVQRYVRTRRNNIQKGLKEQTVLTVLRGSSSSSYLSSQETSLRTYVFTLSEWPLIMNLKTDRKHEWICTQCTPCTQGKSTSAKM
ncbi:hypothetical protein WA026_009524 [Henosepilachna vigintioctopunctata]|uniref:Uncharacterized protein n=1 Tax=Henosepilachna vigintioctopunctata TaxID=420089 RepID=A0AAW1TVX2_9CUCU